jgi:hypothetical protein
MGRRDGRERLDYEGLLRGGDAGDEVAAVESSL